VMKASRELKGCQGPKRLRGLNLVPFGENGDHVTKMTVFRDFWTKKGRFLKKRRHGQQGAPQGNAIELERRAKEQWWRRYSRAKVQKVWLGEKNRARI